MRTIVREIRRAESMIKIGKVDEDRLTLFERLKDYVVSGSYFPYSQGKILFDNLFEYDIVLANKLGISEASVRKLRSNLSQALYDKLGYDVVDKILFGSEADLRSVDETLSLAEIDVNLSDLFSWELLQFISNQTSDEVVGSYDIGEFELELAFLKRYLLISMKRDALDCDLSKLRFILDRLKGGSAHSSVDKYILKSLLFNKN